MRRQEASVATVPTGVADLLESLPVATALLDGRGRVLALNDAWMRLARPGGLAAPDDKRGDDHLHVLDTARGFAHAPAKRLADAIRKVLAGEKERVRIPYKLADASLEAVVYRGDGAAFEAVVFHVDRTAEEQSEVTAKRLDELRVEHTALVAWRDDHLDRLAARLRATHGPMTPVRIHLHRLRSGKLGPLTDEQRAAVDAIDAAVARWCALQDAAIAEADGGAEILDLAALAGDVVATVRPDGLRRGVRIEEDLEATLVEADGTLRPAVLAMLRWVVRSAPSGATVRVGVEPSILRITAEHTSEEGLSWPGLRYAEQALQALQGTLVAKQVGIVMDLAIELPPI